MSTYPGDTTLPDHLESAADRLRWMRIFKYVRDLYHDPKQKIAHGRPQTEKIHALYKHWQRVGHINACASTLRIKCAGGTLRDVIIALFPEIEIPDFNRLPRGNQRK